VVLPGWTVDYIAEVPGGAHPSYALGYSQRDNDFYVEWDAISRDRDTFRQWLGTDVFGAAGPGGMARAGAHGGGSGS
jgi:glutaconate CoA-transferase subunit A